MKRWVTLLLTLVMLMGLAIPSHAAAALDKAHVKFLQSYTDAYASGDPAKFKALLASKSLFDESATGDFEVIADFNETKGLIKFYVGDNVKLAKKDTKKSTYTYTFDMYTLIATSETAIIQKIPTTLVFKKSGSTFKITDEKTKDGEEVETLDLVPKGVMKKIDTDYKKKFEVTLTDFINSASEE